MTDRDTSPLQSESTLGLGGLTLDKLRLVRNELRGLNLPPEELLARTGTIPAGISTKGESLFALKIFTIVPLDMEVREQIREIANRDAALYVEFGIDSILKPLEPSK